MIRIPNSTPTTVSFVQKSDERNESDIAKSQIARLSREEVIAAGEADAANFRLAKATEAMKASEIAYFEAVAKSAPNTDELRKAYNNALAGFRDADANAQKTAENLTLSKSALAGVLNVAKREFSSDKRQELADKGKAMPDGSFPIESKADLANAVQSVGRAKNVPAAKKHIIAQAKKLGATDALPEEWSEGQKMSKNITGDLTKAVLKQIEKGAVLVLCPSCMSGDDASCPLCAGMNGGMVPQSWVTGDESKDYEDSSEPMGEDMAKAFSTDSLLTREFQKSAGFLAYITKGGPGSGPEVGHPFRGNQHTGGITYGAALMHDREGWKNTIKRYNASTTAARKEADDHIAQGDRASRAGDHATASEHYRTAAKKYMEAHGGQYGAGSIMHEKADQAHPDSSHTEGNMYMDNARMFRTMSEGASSKAASAERMMAQTA